MHEPVRSRNSCIRLQHTCSAPLCALCRRRFCSCSGHRGQLRLQSLQGCQPLALSHRLRMLGGGSGQGCAQAGAHLGQESPAQIKQPSSGSATMTLLPDMSRHSGQCCLSREGSAHALVTRFKCRRGTKMIWAIQLTPVRRLPLQGSP